MNLVNQATVFFIISLKPAVQVDTTEWLTGPGYPTFCTLPNPIRAFRWYPKSIFRWFSQEVFEICDKITTF